MTTPALLLRPTGALDAETSGALRQQLATAFRTGVRSIVVDLSGISAADVTGLQVLAGAARHLRKRQGSLVVSAASPELTRMLRVNGMADLLELPAAGRLHVVSVDLEAAEREAWPEETPPTERRLRVVSTETG